MNERQTKANQEDLWRINNYILLKDYLDKTVSRIAARCVRSGNIAIEEYPFYGYILDVLEEICETGEYILSRDYLFPLVEEKVAGGLAEFKKTYAEFRQELGSNSATLPEETDLDTANIKDVFGGLDFDPTQGAGMSADDVIAKLSQAQEENLELMPDGVSVPEDSSAFAPSDDSIFLDDEGDL